MTDLSDRKSAFDAHEKNCPKYTERLAKRRAAYPQFSEGGERYQMSALYFDHVRVQGRYVAEIKCDGRCMGAKGHNCECSCGGANHGSHAMA